MTREPNLVVIGLGANLGDRRATIEAAIGAISDLPGVATCVGVGIAVIGMIAERATK